MPPHFTPKLLTLLLITLLLGACGFHLRGQVRMPFDTLYVDAVNPNTALISELRNGLAANRVRLVESADQATVVLNIVSEFPDKQILSLGSDGRVNEFRLQYRVSLRAYGKELDYIPAEDFSIRRDFSYDDTKVLAKEAEEAMLFQSMRSDMVQQILRRLSRAKPQPK